MTADHQIYEFFNPQDSTAIYSSAAGAQAMDAFADGAWSMVDARLNGMETTGLASGNASHGVREWGQVFGMTGHEGERGGLAGADLHSAGLAVGADSQNIWDRFVVGAALNYAHTQVNPRDATIADTRTDSYQFTLYGDYKLPDHAFLRGMAAYAYSDNDTARNVPFSTTAHGNYGANEFTLLAKAGKNYAWNHTMLTPSILARYVHYDPGNYTETGAGLDDDTVMQASVDALEVGPGLDAAWKIHNSSGGWIVPSVHVNYRYDVIGDRVDTTYKSLCCGTFVVKGQAPERSRINLGANATWYQTGPWEFRAAYDYDYRGAYMAHTGVLRATMRY